MAVEDAGTHENVTSFRAVPDRATLASRIEPLNDLPGRWMGHGFNIIARPDFQGGNDIFLELNLTKESLDFMTIGSPIPNRGSAQDDIFLRGVHYLQQISDSTNHGALHIEPGIWLNIPATSAPRAPATIARLATIPHGDSVNAQGRASVVNGPPNIGHANTVPFPVRTAPPPFGTPNGFPEYNLARPHRFRTSPVPHGITQEMVNDPNSVLRSVLHPQHVLETTVLDVSTRPTGGIENIPFVVHNANAVFMHSTFWVEKVAHPAGHTFMQLQYSQTVLLNFLDLSWPHVTVATLVKAF